MRHILLIFLDGIGLGEASTETNPFAVAEMPTLQQFTNGQAWLKNLPRIETDHSLFIPTDPRMGVAGRPQSASGQASILTGINVPERIGEHYGPRPNPAIRAILAEDNFFKQVVNRGMTASLLEAYPPQFHKVIDSGKRLRSSYQQAPHEAGLRLFTEDDYNAGNALSVDWTGEGWRRDLGYTDSPVYTPEEAGRKMVELSRQYHFAFFPNWATDMIGHRGSVADGVKMLETFDGVMAGALSLWDMDEGLIIITSDHGNLEDLSHTKHTENDVPTLIIGNEKHLFRDLHTLADITPLMAQYLFAS